MRVESVRSDARSVGGFGRVEGVIGCLGYCRRETALAADLADFEDDAPMVDEALVSLCACGRMVVVVVHPRDTFLRSALGD